MPHDFSSPPAPIRSTFVFWSQALQEPERLLDDLSRFTRINTVELGPFYSTSGIAGGGIPAGEGQRAAISSAKEFNGLRVSTASKEELGAIQGFIRLARSRGFSVACQYAPLYVPTTRPASLACVDIAGRKIYPPLSPPQPIVKPVSLYGCPNNRDVVRYGEAMMRQLVESWAPADIITLNHVEFPMWPGRRAEEFLIQDLFSCFCESCEERASAEERIDFALIKQEVASLYQALSKKRRTSNRPLPAQITPNDVLNALIERPALASWLHFRSKSMTEYIKRIVIAGREATREYNPSLKIGLESQLPALSNLLGTDFVELAPHFDFLVPKLPDYLASNTIPIIAGTIASRTGAAKAEDVGRILHELLDLGPGPKEYKRRASPTNTLYDVPFDLSMIDRQMKYLAPVVGKVPLYPYIWFEDADAKLFGEKVRALRRNGMDGYFIWQWEPDLTREALKTRAGIY